MPKLKLNLDLTRVKALLLAKGERIALAVCGCAALLLLAFTFMGAMGAGKPTKGNKSSWKEAFSDETRRLSDKIALADKEPVVDDADPKKIVVKDVGDLGVWPEVKPGANQNPFFQLPDPVDTKRRRPTISLAREERVEVQINQGGYYFYEIDPAKPKVTVFKSGGGAGGAVGGSTTPMTGTIAGGGATGAEPLPVKKFRAVRMAVISAVFPLKQQMEMYRTALRHPTLEDLLAKGDIPKAVGLIVYRAEKTSDGKWGKPLALYDAIPKTGETKIDSKNFKQTYDLFRYGMFDMAEPNIYGPHVVGGLMTPLPLMANAEIPAAKNLTGIAVDEALRLKTTTGGPDKVGMPVMPMDKGGLPGAPKKEDMGGDAGAGALPTEQVDFDKFPRHKERFLGTLKPFPPREELLGYAVIGADGSKMPMPMGEISKPMPMGETGLPGKDGYLGVKPPEDALIRFVDADVRAGKTYKYWVKVRFANPNFGPQFEKEVAYKELTNELELTSATYWEVPREIVVPNEFFYYVVDETPRSDIKEGSDHPKRAPYAKGEYLAMQLHRWILETSDGGRIGDWAIAERLVIRKGEFIGRQTVKVELPEWEEKQNAFRLNIRADVDKKGKKPKGETAGIPIDFTGDFSLSTTKPSKHALVDFDGGDLTGRTDKGTTINEKVAIQALILTPDGKLSVRNSEDDKGATPRVQRLESWRRRIEETMRGPAVGPAGMGGGLPGT